MSGNVKILLLTGIIVTVGGAYLTMLSMHLHQAPSIIEIGLIVVGIVMILHSLMKMQSIR